MIALQQAERIRQETWDKLWDTIKDRLASWPGTWNFKQSPDTVWFEYSRSRVVVQNVFKGSIAMIATWETGLFRKTSQVKHAYSYLDAYMETDREIGQNLRTFENDLLAFLKQIK